MWTDSESSVLSIFSLKTNSPLSQDIQKEDIQDFFSTLQILNSVGLKRTWDMRVKRRRISSQRKPPWKGSQHNIQHTGASSERNPMLSPLNSDRMNGTKATLEGTSIASFQR
ncbi:hypothetical protein AVEN_242151-1 [Araneus ventricosus]|uniref:Uncharacterized protein n=1 Tax=Araneus ventricosus TaxID=182803 RepID=A0A4Y2DE89_ARAVE|nr:hypothetical protein AVEN_242151-1 [Araneus ventricosus]